MADPTPTPTTWAVFALTPKSLAKGGIIPHNVPNPTYAPDIMYGLQLLTPWFAVQDNASLALVQLQTVALPARALCLKILSSTDVSGPDATSYVAPSVGIMPMKAQAEPVTLPDGVTVPADAPAPGGPPSYTPYVPVPAVIDPNIPAPPANFPKS